MPAVFFVVCPVWQFIRQTPRLLNAGVDINGYVPVTFDELVTNNEMFKADNLK